MSFSFIIVIYGVWFNFVLLALTFIGEPESTLEEGRARTDKSVVRVECRQVFRFHQPARQTRARIVTADIGTRAQVV